MTSTGKHNLILVLLLLAGIALLNSWSVPKPEPAKSEEPAEHVLVPPKAEIRDFSVNYIPVGVKREELITRFGSVFLKGSDFKYRGADVSLMREISYVVTGSTLQRKGKEILRAGDTLDKAQEVLGTPVRKPGGLFFDYGPVTIQVHEGKAVEKITLYYDEIMTR